MARKRIEDAAEPSPGPKPKKPRSSKPGRPKKGQEKLSVLKVVDALAANAYVFSMAAEQLGVATQSLRAWVKRRPEIAEHIEEAEEDLLDLACMNVRLAVTSGDMTTVRWYLGFKGQARGFGMKGAGLPGMNVRPDGRGGFDISQLAADAPVLRPDEPGPANPIL